MHDHFSPACDLPILLNRIRSLDQRGPRDREGCLWIDGVRPFVCAVDAGQRIRLIVESERLNTNAIARKQSRQLARDGVPRLRVSPEQFRSIATTDRASGIGAIVEQPWCDLRDESFGDGFCWIAAESIRSPGNMGTMLRTAEAVGATGLIALSHRLDPFDPACVRATMGGLFGLRFARSEPELLRRWAEEHGAMIVGLDAEGAHSWADAPLGDRVVLLAGDERAGLSPRSRAACHQYVRLPMSGRADSLNVGVATSVMLYELVRRRLISWVPGEPSCAAPSARRTTAADHCR
jgi:TrmH family RNA methyltransferase